MFFFLSFFSHFFLFYAGATTDKLITTKTVDQVGLLVSRTIRGQRRIESRR